MKPVAAIANIRAAIAGSAEAREWVLGRLEIYLTQAATGLTMEAAFGVAGEQSQPRWWRQEAYRDRDNAIRELANTLEGSIGARATAIAEMGRRYSDRQWLIDRQRDAMPEAYRGTRKQLLWQAFKTGTEFPATARRVRDILDQNLGCETGTMVRLHKISDTESLKEIPHEHSELS